MTDLPMFVPPGGLDPASKVGGTAATFHAIAAQKSEILPGVVIGSDPGARFYMGVNLSGQEYIDADNNTDLPQFPNESYFAYYASRGVHFMRFTGLWEHFQPVLFQDFRADYMAKWEECIVLAAKYGIAILADPFHNYGQRLVDGKAHYLGDSVLTKEAFADSWKRFAAYMDRHKNIFGWDLMGEPSSTDGSLTADTWNACAQAAINAIRTVDPVRQIHVEGLQWASSFYWEDNNPNIHTLTDSANNLVFQAHCYLDRNASGGYLYWDEEVAAGDQFSHFSTYDDTIGVKRLRPFVEWLKKHNLRGAIGEIGTGRFDNQTTKKAVGWTRALDNALAYLRANTVPAFYWASGPYGNLSGKNNQGQTWVDQQPGSLDPVGSTWYAGIDPYGEETPQMAVVRKYVDTSDSIITYDVNYVPSADGTGFVIQVTSLCRVQEPFKILLSDNDAGGIFRGGRVLDIPIGPGFFAEITYIPPSVQEAVTISFQNTGALVDPAGLVISGIANMFGLYGYTAIAAVWPRKVIPNYNGPAYTLLKSDGTATKDVPYKGTGGLPDLSSLKDWDTGTPTVRTFYDQSGNGADFGPIVTTNNMWGSDNKTPVPSSPTDYPALEVDGVTQVPYLKYGGAAGDKTIANRMDAKIPIDGLGELTLFIAVRPRSLFGQDVDNFLQWNDQAAFTVGSGDYSWDISTDTPKSVALGFNCNEIALYTVHFSGGVKTTYRNGVKIATAQSASDVITSPYNDICNIGWYRWYRASTKLDMFGLIAISSYMDEAALTAWHRSLMADIAIEKSKAVEYQLTADMIGFGDTDVAKALQAIDTAASMPNTYTLQVIQTDLNPIVKITVPGPVSKPFDIVLTDSVGGWFEGGATIRIPASQTTTIATRVYHPPAYYCSVWLNATNTGGITDPAPQVVRFMVNIFSNNGVVPLCVLWPRKLIPSYTGAAITLMASDGKTVKDLAFDSVTGIAPVSEAQAFDPNSTVQYLHDQTYSFPMGPIASSNNWSTDQTQVPTQKSDYPTLISAPGTDLPVLRFNGNNRMDVKLPIDGRKKFTLFILVKTSDSWADEDAVISWYLQNNLRVLHGATRKVTLVNATTKVTKDFDTGWQASDGFQLYCVEFDTGALSTYKGLDGQTLAGDTGLPALADPFNEYMNIGWDRWYKSNTKFSLVGIVAINDALSDVIRNRIATSLIVDAGLALPEVFGPADVTKTTAAEMGFNNLTVERAIKELTAMSKFHASILKARVNFFATYAVQSNEVVGSFVADIPLTWDKDFAGSVGSVGVPPSALYSFKLLRNKDNIGTITVSPQGQVIFSSNDQVTANLNVGDVVTIVGNAVADPVMNNFYCNLVFTPYAPELAYPE